MKIVSNVWVLRTFVFDVLASRLKEFLFLFDSGNPKTIHRDVKAANILIDDSFEAKVF